MTYMSIAITIAIIMPPLTCEPGKNWSRPNFGVSTPLKVVLYTYALFVLSTTFLKLLTSKAHVTTFAAIQFVIMLARTSLMLR